jgi:hypothetical protein
MAEKGNLITEMGLLDRSDPHLNWSVLLLDVLFELFDCMHALT